MLDDALNDELLTSQHAGDLDGTSRRCGGSQERGEEGGEEEQGANSCTADRRRAWPVGHATGVSEVRVTCVESTHKPWSCCAVLGKVFTIR